MPQLSVIILHGANGTQDFSSVLMSHAFTKKDVVCGENYQSFAVATATPFPMIVWNTDGGAQQDGWSTTW